ncbi:MAG: flagellar biosynthesis protein FlhF, partial [Sulfurihydrogenibium azorense]
KIASDLVLNKNKKVAVLSIDTFKAGAADQARSYSNILGIPFYLLSDPKKIRETVDDLNFVDVILIDTIGRSHYDHWKLGEMKETLRFLDEAQYMMVLSANMNTKESFNIIKKYQKFFKIDYLFFTKIDETSYPGVILNLTVKTGIPLTYISTGQNVPEDIKVLTPERLVSLLLKETD